MRLTTRVLLAVFLAQFGAMAQSGAAQPKLAFDVVSVKPSPVGIDSATSDLQPGSFRGTNRTVEWMMRLAYGVQATQISGGPAWLRSDGFDINARVDSAEPVDMKQMQAQIGPLLRQLLEDRFQLKVHRETRPAPVYSLVVGKNGTRLKPSQGGEMSMKSNMEDGKMVLEGVALTMPTFAGFLARQLGRTVTDKTSLTGTYDVHLEWARDLGPESTAGSIFSAVQEQLGLKLETTKGTIDIVVVDSVSRPSEN